MPFWDMSRRTLHPDEGILTHLVSEYGKATKAYGMSNGLDGLTFDNCSKLMDTIDEKLTSLHQKTWFHKKSIQRIWTAIYDYGQAMYANGQVGGLPGTFEYGDACLTYGEACEAIQEHFKKYYWHRFLDFIGYFG